MPVHQPATDKNKEKLMNKKRLLLICFIFCLNLIISISVQAATSKQAPIYNKFLQKNPSYTWFCTLDINKDGIKELIVSTNQTERFSNNYLIYTVKKGKMVYIGKIQHTLSTDGKSKAIFYNPNFKAIREIYQGAQTIEHNLYKISNSSFKEAKFQYFPITTSGINSYKKSLKQYFYKGCKKYKLYKNTAQNRSNKL